MKIRIAVLVLICLFFAFGYWPCIQVSNSKYIKKLINAKNINSVFILYGKTLCGTCSAGKTVNSYGKRKDILLIVPQEYSGNDIENLKYSFNIYGYVLVGDKNTVKYLKLVSKCLNLIEWHQNILINSKNGEITRI